MGLTNPYSGDYFELESAGELIDECERRAVRILGIEWYTLEGRGDEDAIDWTGWGHLDGRPREESWQAARALLSDGIPDGGTHVEIVYDSADLGVKGLVAGLPMRGRWWVYRVINRMDTFRGVYDSADFALDHSDALRLVDECKAKKARILAVAWRHENDEGTRVIGERNLRAWAKDPPEESLRAARAFLEKGVPQDVADGELLVYERDPPTRGEIPDGEAYVVIGVQKGGLLRRLRRLPTVAPSSG